MTRSPKHHYLNTCKTLEPLSRRNTFFVFGKCERKKPKTEFSEAWGGSRTTTKPCYVRACKTPPYHALRARVILRITTRANERSEPPCSAPPRE